jgi:hypothetical protein
MPITEDQTRVYELLTNIGIKLITGISCNVAFWYILITVINAKTPLQAWTLTVLDAILGGTMFMLVSHYFPALKALRKKPAVRTGGRH